MDEEEQKPPPQGLLDAVIRVSNMTESMRRMAGNDEQRGIVAALDKVLAALADQSESPLTKAREQFEHVTVGSVPDTNKWLASISDNCDGTRHMGEGDTPDEALNIALTKAKACEDGDKCCHGNSWCPGENSDGSKKLYCSVECSSKALARALVKGSEDSE